jgi:repressor LexA
MTKDLKKDKLRSRVREIARFYHKNSRMPSFSEIGELCGLRSKNAVFKLVNKLEELKVLERDRKGRLKPRSLAHTARLLGTVEAGWPSPAEEELADTMSLDDFLIRNPQSTFLLKVTGDSMIDAGILPGETPKSGHIVIAEVDNEWTMKYLKKRGSSVTLLPANPKYKPVKPKQELRIAGIVTAVIRKYG